MPDTLLRTKLYVPPLRPKLVTRPRLIDRLNLGLHLGHKLTLISAPAGFGKSTLASEWIAGCERPAAWLSLEEADNDPARFLTYLVAALQMIAPAVGEGVLALLQSPQPPPTESILTALLNEITAVRDNFILVLDDYHVIATQAVDALTSVDASTNVDASTDVDGALTFLLEHLPPQMHLVIATREDPYLPLSRLRVRSQLTELRAADLRFTLSEAAEFLNEAMGLDLATEDIAALETRTEGWIAGLQLAAISMRGREDASSLIKSFTGSHRFVLDYLIEEVLNQQPQNVQNFMLQTAILKRLTSPLCDAVTGQENGQAILEMLDRANLFIVPLDNERQWYRYHHLFADLLRQRLERSSDSAAGEKSVAELHGRASIWYEENGLQSEALHHALAARDFERAAGLVELAWPAMEGSFQSAVWLGWVRALPDALIRARPVLCVDYAWALLDRGEMAEVEARLQDAERWLDTAGDGSAPPQGAAEGMIVVDEEQFRSLPVTIASARAYQAQALGDLSGALKFAELTLKLTPEDDLFRRAQATATLGLTYWASGDLEAARRAMTDWVDSMQKAGNPVFAIASAFALADIIAEQGHLHEAVRTYKESLQLAAEHDGDVQNIIAHHYLGLAMLYHEMGEQEAAARHLHKSSELGEQSTLIDWPYRWCIARARLRESGGDLEAALDLLDEAKRVYVPNPVPDGRPVGALKAKVSIRQGRLSEAQAWARERGLAADDDLSYLREFEHITLARVLLAEYESDQADRPLGEAMGVLARLLRAAEDERRLGNLIEILILQALAYQAQGNIPLALVSLKRALATAEPQGYFRIFVDEGPAMAQLLVAAAAQGIMPDYAGKLLAAFSPTGSQEAGTSKTHSGLQTPNSELIEPLSARELEVLQLIAEGLSNREIAARLYLSLNTVKVHTRNIYSKLDVHHRAQAAARARALGILPGG